MPVVIVDHESSDGTLAVARSHGATVFVRPFEGFLNARRFALEQVQTPWTLMIDADEVLDRRLRDAILEASQDFDGYYLSRTTFYCGRAMRMWSGERLLRFFRTNKARLEAAPAAGGTAHLHERWICDGPVGMLDGTLLHYSYPTPAAYREKYERYTAIEAAGVQSTRSKWLAQVARTPLRFFWYALVRGAVLDGSLGLQVAWWSAWYPAVVQWKAMYPSMPQGDND
jgi:glycosyltransferase involved in cell wall biosynthesis